jgi:hypothetical protein
MFKHFFSNLFSDPFSLIVSMIGIILSAVTFGAALSLVFAAKALIAATLILADVVAFGFDIPWLKVGVAAICFAMNLYSLLSQPLKLYLTSGGLFEETDMLVKLAIKYSFWTEALLITTWTVSLYATYVSSYSSSTSYAAAFADITTELGASVGTVVGGVVGGAAGAIAGASDGVFSGLGKLMSSPLGLLIIALVIWYFFFKDSSQGSVVRLDTSRQSGGYVQQPITA